jgi:acyl-homoserine-lactone acylase
MSIKEFRMRATALALMAFLVSCSPAWAQPDAEILWDTWGVPHIYAPTQQQAFRAFGYAQMHAHADLLLRLYAAGRGRAAEVYGAPFVDLDRNTRTLGGPERGAAWYALQSPSFKANIDAFAQGINEYAAQHPDRLTPPSDEVLPVTGVDVMSHMARVLTYIIAAPTECFFLPALNLDGQPASNGWALGPQRTASGNTMLLANPHLSWSDGFQRFFEAQIVAPGVNLSGATFVGVPVPLLGFDDTHGWTHTVSTADGCDVYVLAAQGDVYLLDGQAVPFKRRRRR